MPKKFAEYRLEAEKLNQAALKEGKPAPIPDASSLRKEALAKAVIQVRLDKGENNGN